MCRPQASELGIPSKQLALERSHAKYLSSPRGRPLYLPHEAKTTADPHAQSEHQMLLLGSTHGIQALGAILNEPLLKGVFPPSF